MATKKKAPGSKRPVPDIVRSSAVEYLTFMVASGQSGVEVVYADENVWLTQKMMAALYDVSVPNISMHLKKVFADNELSAGSVVKDFLTTAADGKRYRTQHYNLAAIITVGYKVNSEKAVQFRKWAHMGLTSWSDAPDGKVQRFDVDVAKNYLTEEELIELERLVAVYIDVAESMAHRQIPMTMADWEQRLDILLRATSRDVLQNAGQVSAEAANAHAASEFEKYRLIQDVIYRSDFDRFLELEATIDSELIARGEEEAYGDSA
ncbi:MAG: virulence RhuM family protein [Propionibacteriaceae bacterium]|nr:virulence RhuM family protein [Propionibacteriaceae bacterium]